VEHYVAIPRVKQVLLLNMAEESDVFPEDDD
jgi:hypothetical protein